MKKHIFLSGRVQGVGFRHFTKTKARSLGVKGWVRNLPDGRVEAVFEGDEKLVDQLIEKCKKGPRSAYVQSIDVEEEEEKDAFTEFKVRF
ncbi:acylphosphatase [Gracilimonas sediminicola]|uniref:Acylphosphatase n=1 Tax=Gracilimonas sediminicola TaxID=2952158 RepID=A0A9X2L4C1_9BACT|nr:acylphosphatase [Gracilimonas sediminicola]